MVRVNRPCLEKHFISIDNIVNYDVFIGVHYLIASDQLISAFLRGVGEGSAVLGHAKVMVVDGTLLGLLTLVWQYIGKQYE